MLHHWLPSQEGFGIKWWQAFGTCLNNKKTSFKNVTKLKSESKCDDFLIFFLNGDFFLKNGII
jgi:hypothetical protein